MDNPSNKDISPPNGGSEEEMEKVGYIELTIVNNY